jgi:hypothetical protein
MRGYAAMTASEVLEFARTHTFDVSDIYAPTQSFIGAHTDLDEEEIEYALTVVAAEDALEIAAAADSTPCVVAFEIPEVLISAHHDMSVSLNGPLAWTFVECLFVVSGDGESLTWYAPQEIESALSAAAQ